MKLDFKLTKNSSPTAAQYSVISPVKGSFDLSGGAFKKAEARRRTLTALSLATGAILTGLVMTGFFSAQSAANAESAALAADSQRQEVAGKLAEIDQAEGYAAEDLRTHIAPRQETLTQALTDDVDVVTLTNSILAAVPATMVISGIEITWEKPEAPAVPAEGTDPNALLGEDGAPLEGEDPAAEATPSASAAPVDPLLVKTLRVTAAGDFNSILELKTRLEQIPGVAVMIEDPTWTGAGASTVVTFSTTLTADALSPRAQGLEGLDIYGQPKVAAEGAQPQPVPGVQPSAQPQPVPGVQPSAQPSVQPQPSAQSMEGTP